MKLCRSISPECNGTDGPFTLQCEREPGHKGRHRFSWAPDPANISQAPTVITWKPRRRVARTVARLLLFALFLSSCSSEPVEEPRMLLETHLLCHADDGSVLVDPPNVATVILVKDCETTCGGDEGDEAICRANPYVADRQHVEIPADRGQCIGILMWATGFGKVHTCSVETRTNG